MTRVSRSEWRYAILLVLLLMIGAVAAIHTLRHIDQLLAEIERNRLAQHLRESIEFEQNDLLARARRLTQTVPAADESARAWLGKALSDGWWDLPGRRTAALLDGSGTPLVLEHSALPFVAGDWSALHSSLGRQDEFWTGFSVTDEGLALTAVIRLPRRPPLFAAHDMLVVLDLLDRRRLDSMRSMPSGRIGIASRNGPGTGEEAVVAVLGPAQRRLDALVARPDPARFGHLMRTATISVYAFIVGMLLLAGALGLWAIRSSIQVEGLRRVGRFVDAMDYLSDGLVLFDARGRLVGANPAARAMIQQGERKSDSLSSLFPALHDSDIVELSRGGNKRELERACSRDGKERIWRFRSQSMEGLGLILVSDVTELHAAAMQQKQRAALQLIGHIAHGVAHDFNNILCAISGHAALLHMRAPDSGPANLGAIMEQAQRGARLAASLLDISRTETSREDRAHMEQVAAKASEYLRMGLSPDWEVRVACTPGLPPASLAPFCLEQVLLHLGLLAADTCPDAGFLFLSVDRPDERIPLPDGRYAAMQVDMACSDTERPPSRDPHTWTRADPDDEPGVVLSVVGSMLQEANSRLEIFRDRNNRIAFRIHLPASLAVVPAQESEAAAMLAGYMKRWRILLAARPSSATDRLQTEMEAMGVGVSRTGDLVSTLDAINGPDAYHVAMIDGRLLGQETEAVLRAVGKLKPGMGLVILRDGETPPPPSVPEKVVLVPVGAALQEIAQDIVRAREMAFGSVRSRM